MAFKAVVIAMVSGVTLAGCGSASDSEAPLSENGLSAYEGRVVDNETLAGTWVAVGSGTYSFSSEELIDNEKSVVKEYFVITGSAESGYEKASCDGNYTETVTESGEMISFGFFDGTISDDGVISGQYLKDSSSELVIDTNQMDLTMIKISDESNPIGSAVTNFGNNNIITSEINCYQQTKGNGSFNNLVDENEGNINFTSEYYYTDVLSIFSYTDAVKNIELTHYEEDVYLDTYNGGSADFDVVNRTILSETVEFNGADEGYSILGTMTIQLPVQ